MEFVSNQQIEEELRRALNLNQDQPELNSRRSKGRSYVSSTTSLPSSDVRPTHSSSHHIVSSPENTVIHSSPVGAAEKIPTASSSSSSISNSQQASHVSEAGANRHRRVRRSKQNSSRYVPHGAVGVMGSTGNGKNMSESGKSAGAVKSGSPRTDTVSGDSANASSGLYASASSPSTMTEMNCRSNVGATARTVTDQRGGRGSRGRGRGFTQRMTGAIGLTGSAGNAKNISESQTSAGAVKSGSLSIDTVSGDSANASSVLYAGSPITMTGLNSRNNVGATARTVTDQRGGKANRGRGRGFPQCLAVSAVHGQPLQKSKSDDHTHDVPTSHVTHSGQLCTESNNNTNVKTAALPTADENVTDLSNETGATIAQDSVEQPVKKQEKGKILCA